MFRIHYQSFLVLPYMTFNIKLKTKVAIAIGPLRQNTLLETQIPMFGKLDDHIFNQLH